MIAVAVCGGIAFATLAGLAVGLWRRLPHPAELEADAAWEAQSHHDTLVGPWASVIGPVHPEDGGDQ